MRYGWSEVRLGDLISVKHGWPFKSEAFTQASAERPIVVSIGNFRYTGGFRFESTDLRGYSADYPPDYVLQPGDILLVMTCQTAGGEILGIPGRIPDDGRVYLHNQRMGKVVLNAPSKADRSFLYWAFLTPEFNRSLVASASGTKILHTSPSRIESCHLRLPSLVEQRAIANTLWSLEEAIACNNRINDLLLRMARTLFQHWFVEFGPFQKPGLQDSELGSIPKGWTAQPILDCCKLLSGGTPQTSVPKYWNGDIPWASAKDVSQCAAAFLLNSERTITSLGVENSAAKILPQGTVVIIARGATTGKFTALGRDMAMNQTCYGLRGKDGFSQEWVHLMLVHIVPKLQSAAHGTIFDTITTTTFQTTKIVVPPPSVLAEFTDAVKPWFDQMLANLKENGLLTRTRDYLLPKLLSGEVSVENVEVSA